MGTGLQNNYEFYFGYEGEPEVLFSINKDNAVVYHFWEGFFEDIWGDVEFQKDGWRGIARDYQEEKGVFSGHEYTIETKDLKEYLCDINNNLGKTFEYEESAKVLKLLNEIFLEAIDDGKSIISLYD